MYPSIAIENVNIKRASHFTPSVRSTPRSDFHSTVAWALGTTKVLPRVVARVEHKALSQAAKKFELSHRNEQ